jgi:hypothetical protein
MEDMVIVHMVDILTGNDVNFVIPVLVEQSQLSELLVLLLTELGKVIFDEFHLFAVFAKASLKGKCLPDGFLREWSFQVDQGAGNRVSKV